MANQNSELRNPLFWCFIAFVLGGALLIWGAIKGDCSGPDCWVGSGFLKWAGGVLMAAGAVGFFTLGNRK